MITRTPATSGRRSPCTDSVYLLFTIVETAQYTADRVTRAHRYNVIVGSDAETEYVNLFFFHEDVQYTCNISCRIPPPATTATFAGTKRRRILFDISFQTGNIRFESYVFIINYTSTVRKYEINVQDVF